MATFKDQLEKKRIKTLAQDLLNHPQSTGQLWDTLGLTKGEIEAPNFWDSTMHPLQTNDEIFVRIHDAVNDNVIIATDCKAVAAFAYTDRNGYDYATQLYFINDGETYQSVKFTGLEVVGTYRFTVDSTDLFTFAGDTGAFFLDAEKIPADMQLTVYAEDGTTVVASGLFAANTAVRGQKVEVALDGLAAGSTKYVVEIVTSQESTKSISVQFFAKLKKEAQVVTP